MAKAAGVIRRPFVPRRGVAAELIKVDPRLAVVYPETVPLDMKSSQKVENRNNAFWICEPAVA